MAKKGLLLMNIGSPTSYEVPAVKKYLNTFLMDEDIIKLPFILRWILVHLLIVPRRAPFSAANYKKVWMKTGSPLMVYTEEFAASLQKVLASDYVIELGMRYSDPTIETALDNFQKAGVSEIIVAPLFPQYADATTGSCIKEFKRIYEQKGLKTPWSLLEPFFREFITPFAAIASENVRGKKIDHFLFSFHGLPVAQITQQSGCALNDSCCQAAGACEKNCYRAQSFATARGIATDMGLTSDQWSVSFQSRLGPTEWMRPYTDEVLQQKAQAGVKNIAVLCPAFVADCIETLEEIGMGGRETFQHHGGQEFTLVPCPNADPRWVDTFARLFDEPEF